MKSVLITGGSGTLGHGLTKELLRRGEVERVCIFSRGEKAQSDMRRHFDDPRMRYFIGDVRDRGRLTRALQGCDTLIHAAALKRIEVGVYNPYEMVLTNVQGSENAVEAARDAGVQRAILVSTDKAFEPVSPYGYTKAIGEALFHAANEHYGATCHYSVLRYGNVWCSNGSVVPLWKSILASGGRPVITDPRCTRFFMLLSEAVAFILGALDKMKGGETFIPELPAYRLGDLANAMSPPGTDYWFTGIGLPRHEKLHESMEEGKCSRDARRMTIEELRSHLP